MAGRVLCADGDVRTASILRESLLEQGYDVESVHDGTAALDRLRSDAFDLALIDLPLPSQGGFAVLEAIRSAPSPMCSMPVFLLSPTRPSPDDRERARNGGASAVLVKPIPLARLHELVRKHVKEGPPRVRAGGRPPLPSRSEPYRGELGPLGFGELLGQLHGRRATGVLVLENAGRRKVVRLHEGAPVEVKSNLLGDCLGNRLLDRGLITRAQFDESVARMKAGAGRQGEILLAMKAVEPPTLADALVEHAEHKLLEIFGWHRGEFEFKPGAQLKGGLALPGRRPLAYWQHRGAVAYVPVARVDRRLRRLAGRGLVPAGAPPVRPQELALGEAELALLERVEAAVAPVPIAELRGEQEPLRRAVCALLDAGLAAARPVARECIAATDGDASLPPSGADARADRELRADLAARIERQRRQHPFEILGLSPDASSGEIEAAYERARRTLHPDSVAGGGAALRSLAEDAFAAVEAAYARLRDPKTRGEVVLEIKKQERERAQARAQDREHEAQRELERGEELLRARSYQAALLRFGAALERAPRDGLAHAHYGWCLYLIHSEESAMVQEAIEHLKRGIKLARDHEKPYLLLGRLYKSRDDLEVAEKMFRRAAQIRPESVEAVRELRVINMRRSKGLIGRILRR